MKKKYGVHSYLIGVAMGIADLIPGVSGGTIAFLGGIYERLLNSITNAAKVGILLRNDGFTWKNITAIRKKIDGTFLVIVLSGILTSILAGSRLIERLLEQYPIYVAMFFVGLIVMSAIVLFSQQLATGEKKSWYYNIGFTGLGVLFGLLITVGPIGTLPVNPLGYFFAGILGSVAMILPGISGSYILLIAGMYQHVIGKVSNVSEGITSGNMQLLFSAIPDLFVMMCGIVIGLVIMSNFLKRLLARWHKETVLVLIGCMVGALPTIIPAVGTIVPIWLGSIIAFIGGMIVIYPLIRIAKNVTNSEKI